VKHIVVLHYVFGVVEPSHKNRVIMWNHGGNCLSVFNSFFFFYILCERFQQYLRNPWGEQDCSVNIWTWGQWFHLTREAVWILLLARVSEDLWCGLEMAWVIVLDSSRCVNKLSVKVWTCLSWPCLTWRGCPHSSLSFVRSIWEPPLIEWDYIPAGDWFRGPVSGWPGVPVEQCRCHPSCLGCTPPAKAQLWDCIGSPREAGVSGNEAEPHKGRLGADIFIFVQSICWSLRMLCLNFTCFPWVCLKVCPGHFVVHLVCISAASSVASSWSFTFTVDRTCHITPGLKLCNDLSPLSTLI